MTSRSVVDARELRLLDCLKLLRRRWWLVGLIALVCLGASIGLSVRETPLYRSTAQVLLDRQSGDPLQQQVAGQDAQRQLNNEIRQMESTAAREAVRKAYTGPLEVADVTAVVANVDADVINVSLTATDPAEASRLVNLYVERYIDFRRQNEIDRLLTYAGGVTSQINTVKTNITSVNAPITELDARIAIAPTFGTEIDRLRNERALLVAQLTPQLSSLESQLLFLQQELSKVELSAKLTQVGELRVIRLADVPTVPVSPRTTRSAVLGLAVGLLLGVGAALLRDQFDDVVRSRDVLESVTDLPILGLIPQLESRKGKPERDLATLRQPTSTFSEAFRTLRTSVRFIGIDRPVHLIQIASATSSEGKTTVAGNLAVVMAQTGASVVVAGCDFRRPRLDSLWPLTQGPGLTNVLLGEAELGQAMWKHPEIPSLDILRTGPLPPNPSEILGSPRAAEMFKTLASYYDVVILDSPPVLPVADSLIVAGYADITLVVATEGLTTKRQLGRAIEMLRQVDAPLAGVILNQASRLEGAGYQSLPAAKARLTSSDWDRLDELINAFVTRDAEGTNNGETDTPDPAHARKRYTRWS